MTRRLAKKSLLNCYYVFLLRWSIWLAIVVLALTLMGCVEKSQRGALVKQYQLDQLVSGKTNYNEVLGILGTPTSFSSSDNRIWYYVNLEQTQWAFFNPNIDAEEVYQITFDEKGIYKGYKRFKGEDAVAVTASSVETPTVARNKSVWQELISNFGRFSRGANSPNLPNPLNSDGTVRKP